MFPDTVEKRLKLMDPNLVISSVHEQNLKESTDSGQAHLKVALSGPSILFKDLENKKLQYFICKNCADYVIFEYTSEKWLVHIFELKRTVKNKEWKKIKSQFTGALQNSYALAGALGIRFDINAVDLYTVFRNDKIDKNEVNKANPARVRYEINSKTRQLGENAEQQSLDWLDTQIALDSIENQLFPHIKIKLDIETGYGEYSVST